MYINENKQEVRSKFTNNFLKLSISNNSIKIKKTENENNQDNYDRK